MISSELTRLTVEGDDLDTERAIRESIIVPMSRT